MKYANFAFVLIAIALGFFMLGYSIGRDAPKGTATCAAAHAHTVTEWRPND